MKSIDIVRGIAVVQMIFWQMFDFFSKIDIYRDFPHVVKTINTPPHFSVLVLFLSMSGASLFISVSKKLTKGMKKSEILKYITKRYGSFVIISLFFTTLVFDFCTFFRWEEAIQGIGLTATFASMIILAIYDEKSVKSKFLNRATLIIIFLTTILVILQPIVARNVWGVTKEYMFCNTNMDTGQFLQSLLINSSLRGFFSIRGLLPMVFIGVLLGQMAVSDNLKKSNFPIFLIGITLVLSSALSHFYSHSNESLKGFAIDFYARSYPSLMLEIGILFILFSSVEFILNRENWDLAKTTLNFFVPFGMFTLVSYLGHFLLVYKPLQLISVYTNFNLLNKFGVVESAVLSLALTIVFYQVTLRWAKMR